MDKIRQMIKNEDVQVKILIGGFFIAFALLAVFFA
jgi:hypothetical protein